MIDEAQKLKALAALAWLHRIKDEAIFWVDINEYIVYFIGYIDKAESRIRHVLEVNNGYITQAVREVEEGISHEEEV